MILTAADEKDNIRKNFISIRNSMDVASQESDSTAACRNLIPMLNGFSAVGIYAPIDSEVRTGLIHSYLVGMGIQALYPAVRNYGGNRTMVFTRISDPRELNHFKNGFPQPRKFYTYPRNAIDAIVVPGAAFDHCGNRIGYGAGYFDRYLSKFDGLKIAICYDFQLTDKLPSEEFDVKMDTIVTDKRALKIIG